jgi:hypothetical protein
MPATASLILDLFCVPPAARLLAKLPVAPAALSLSQAIKETRRLVVCIAHSKHLQGVEKPNFFPKTAAFEAKPAAPAPAAKAAAGGEGKEKKAAPVVTVVTSGDVSPATS